MENDQFTILVAFNGKMAVANVTPIENPIHYAYEIELPGLATEVYTFEDEQAYDVSKDANDNDVLTSKEFSSENAGWAEGDKGKTKFSTAVGKAIEAFQKEGYQPFAIEVDGRKLVASGCNDPVVPSV